MSNGLRLNHININGFRPFGTFEAELGSLEVLVGANGSGKSSFFEFLRFLRDSMTAPIPPEIVAGSLGRGIFHKPGSDEFAWVLYISNKSKSVIYNGSIHGPVGRPAITSEFAEVPNDYDLLIETNDRGEVIYRSDRKWRSLVLCYCH